MSGYEFARLDELEASGGWIPLRRLWGVTAFGTNAWRADEVGGTVIGEHDEATLRHEELYVVVSGAATFTVGAETFDAPAGSVVFVRDPTLTRKAVGREAGTTIVTVGARPGEAFTPSAWEENAPVLPLFAAGDYAGAKAYLEEALGRHPDHGGILYNLACAEARLDEREPALTHLQRALSLEPRLRANAAEDPDLESLRDDERFRAAVAGEPAPGGPGA